jgi:hypothetical protein
LLQKHLKIHWDQKDSLVHTLLLLQKSNLEKLIDVS